MQRIFPCMNIFTAFFGQKAIILFIALLDAPLNSKTNPIQLNFHNWFSFFYFRARRAILLSYILHKTIQFNTYSIKPNFFSSFCLWFTFSPPHSVGACCALRDLPALLGLHTNSAGSLSFSLPFTPSGCVCVSCKWRPTQNVSASIVFGAVSFFYGLTFCYWNLKHFENQFAAEPILSNSPRSLCVSHAHI